MDILHSTWFWLFVIVALVMGALGDQLPEAFRKDRSEFSGRPFNAENLKAMQPVARDQTYAQLTFAELMLRDGRPFLLGAAPCLADCALYNPVWFLQARMGQGNTPPPLDRLPKLVEWSARMKAMGSGKYAGGIWMEGSSSTEETAYWLNLLIDTTDMNVHQLKARLLAAFDLESEALRLQIAVESFGFKHGVPVDADLMFDVRCLPNPHFVPTLRPRTERRRFGFG